MGEQLLYRSEKGRSNQPIEVEIPFATALPRKRTIVQSSRVFPQPLCRNCGQKKERGSRCCALFGCQSEF